MSRVPALTESDAFASFASAVGASRADRLWRMHVVSDGAGGLRVDRTGEADHVPFAVHGLAGLPDRLEVWLIHANGTRELGTTLVRRRCGSDLDLAQFDDQPTLAAGTSFLLRLTRSHSVFWPMGTVWPIWLRPYDAGTSEE